MFAQSDLRGVRCRRNDVMSCAYRFHTNHYNDRARGDQFFLDLEARNLYTEFRYRSFELLHSARDDLFFCFDVVTAPNNFCRTLQEEEC